MEIDASKLKSRRKAELSVFTDELEVAFDPKDFDPDRPSHARGVPTDPSPSASAPPAPTSLARFEVKAEPRTILDQSRVVTRDKVETNHRQSEDKTRDKVESQLETKQRQSRDTGTAANLKTRDKVESQLETQLETKQRQSRDKVETNTPISALVGLQRSVLLALYDSCKRNRSRTTEQLAIVALAQSLETSVCSIKKTIQRLEGRALISRAEFKNGRAGWTSYSLSDSVFREILQLETEDKLRTNWRQSRDKLESQLETQPETSAPSSSSFIDLENLKTTTTGEPEFFDDARVLLSPDWAVVDFSDLAEVGFSRAHLVQLAKHGKLSAGEVQDSIHFFAFDLKRNGKGRELKGPPVNFFMGILRKGMPYAPPENYESPETEARRRYIEGKRRLEEKRLAEKRELQDLEFAEWSRELSLEEINALVPDVVRHAPKAREHSLRAYFNESVWPARRLNLPGTEAERAEIAQQIENSLMGE
jgi:hypothetical protein